ncbi:hypothetical protein [Cardiobacterium hominis]|uniref:hypothetical protein n=1 Tax=Cardiobacterium hominis TaxID=2718 RepID=UPI0028EA2552|nr:hypothetical protein [Cardiobacterium hominis]
MATPEPDRLPLPLSEHSGDRDSARLALPLRAKGGITPPPPQPPPKPKTVRISGCSGARVAPTLDVSACLPAVGQPALASNCLPAEVTPMQDIALCQRHAITPVPSLGNCQTAHISPTYRIATCARVGIGAYPALAHCAAPRSTAAAAIKTCTVANTAAAPALRGCAAPRVSIAPLLVSCMRQHGWGLPLRACQPVRYQRAVRPPCEYYPIPLPPPPPDLSPCRIRPPSDRLPLPFARRRISRDSARLALPLRCWHDGNTNDLPILPGYIMHNKITADLNGEPLDLLALSLTTDTASYCWQGDITLSPASFAKLKIDQRAAGDEAVITLRINGNRWDILAEDYRDTRKFIGHSYTVTGRSITAKLGADYAKGRHSKYDAARYARQIADEQLNLLPYHIAAWEAVDWLIPGDSYTVSGQTPIEVIADLAKAAGAFVESHPYEAQLFVRPVWRQPAWAKPTPALTIPANLILSVSGQRRISERCNAVRLTPAAEQIGGAKAKGGLVYREGTDQQPEASTLTHAAYTDTDVMRAAGIHALSETGTHKIETVTLPWAEKYQLPLASLGAVWAFAEQGQTWQGVIKGVSVTVELDNGAPVVTQTVTIDRYLGD